MKLLPTVLSATLAVALTSTSAFATSIVTEWNDVFLQAVRDVKFGPPQTARAGAIVHTCIFDAWACYDAKAEGTQYLGYLRRPEAERTDANKAIAISFAAYRALVDLFPARKADFDAKMAALTLDPMIVSTDVSTPSGLGNVVSTAVLNDRHYDGANQLGDLHAGAYTDYTGYTAVNAAHDPANPGETITDPNAWQPLFFHGPDPATNPPKYVVPQWGNVTPFALLFPGQFRPIPPVMYPTNPPPPFPTSKAQYKKQAEYIINITARLNDRKKAIAEYWADGPASETPPGHWNLHAKFVSNRDMMNVDQDAKLFFALNNAVLDASIATWECKRFYNSVRPITAIHFLKQGETIPTYNGQTVLGENWKPYQPDSFLTPPFPEYSSGHSCFSAAAATILRTFTGSDAFGGSATVAMGSSKVQPGVSPAADVQLSWDTFTDAANEAGVSRRYGGIHFPQGDLAGRALGRKIGKTVFAKCLLYFKGKANPGD
jgi:hypothetical protein